MKTGIDYIYVDKADVDEGLSKGKITKAALYFTREYIYVVPFESLQILFAGVESQSKRMNEILNEINKKLPDLDKVSMHQFLKDILEPERIYRIADLEKFSIQAGFWIFGGIRVRKKGGELQTFNIQPASLRNTIQKFYKFQAEIHEG